MLLGSLINFRIIEFFIGEGTEGRSIGVVELLDEATPFAERHVRAALELVESCAPLLSVGEDPAAGEPEELEGPAGIS